MITQADIDSVKKMLDRKEKLLMNLQAATKRGSSVNISIGDTRVEISMNNLKYSEFSRMTAQAIKDRISTIDYDCLKFGVSPSVEKK